MIRLKKTVSQCLIIALILSFMAIEVSADESTEQETETKVVVEETEDSNSEKVVCEVSTNASIIITFDADYRVTVGEAMEVLEVEAFTQEGVTLITALFTDDEGLYNVTVYSLDDIIELLMEQVIVVEGEESPELELMVIAESIELLNSLAATLTVTYEIDVETELEEAECEDKAQPAFIQKRFMMAEALGINPGKMRLFEKYIESLDLEEGESLSVEALNALTELSVKDLMKGTKANKRDKKIEKEHILTSETDAVEEVEDYLGEKVVKEMKKDEASKSKKSESKGILGKAKGKK